MCLSYREMVVSAYEGKTIKQFFDGFGESAVRGDGETGDLAEGEMTSLRHLSNGG